MRRRLEVVHRDFRAPGTVGQEHRTRFRPRPVGVRDGRVPHLDDLPTVRAQVVLREQAFCATACHIQGREVRIEFLDTTADETIGLLGHDVTVERLEDHVLEIPLGHAQLDVEAGALDAPHPFGVLTVLADDGARDPHAMARESPPRIANEDQRVAHEGLDVGDLGNVSGNGLVVDLFDALGARCSTGDDQRVLGGSEHSQIGRLVLLVLLGHEARYPIMV